MYCPKCKSYDELDFDPLQNIEAFMKYVQIEQKKWKAFKEKRKREGKILPNPARKLEDDSASDITQLDKKEILSHYYSAVMTKAQKKNAERRKTQERLYDNKRCGDGKTCGACMTKYGRNRPKSCRNKATVRMELREVKKPVVMFDEEISAH
jgi:hypothetical protein